MQMEIQRQFVNSERQNRCFPANPQTVGSGDFSWRNQGSFVLLYQLTQKRNGNIKKQTDNRNT